MVKPHETVIHIGRIHLRDWQLWWMAISVIVALTVTLIWVYAPDLVSAPHDLRAEYRLYLFGLSCLIALFSAYVIHTHYRLGIVNRGLVHTLQETAEALAKTNEALGAEVTEHKRAAERLRQAHADLQATKRQLIQAEKMESVGRLAAGVAHEVKNPLATILLAVQHLSQHPALDDSKRTAALKDIDDAVKRADGVIKGLLDFSTPMPLKMKDEDLNAVVEQALLLVRYELDRHHITVKTLGGIVPRVQLDRNKIEQVLVNLYLNAIHAMPTGGTLTITTALKPWTNAGPHMEDRPGERFKVGEPVIVTDVEDTGPGVPTDQLGTIFDPFFTTKPRGIGTGLGLAVARSIVELHGGVLDIENRDEGGVRAAIWLKTDGRP